MKAFAREDKKTYNYDTYKNFVLDEQLMSFKSEYKNVNSVRALFSTRFSGIVARRH